MKGIPRIVKLDKKALLDQISDYTVAQMEAKVRPIILEEIERANNSLVRDFVAHKISEEIAAGIYAENTSNTLDGYGNLFSFIGFNLGDNPIDFVAQLLADSIKVSAIRVRRRSLTVLFNIKMPDKEQIFSKTPLPWTEGGRSWLEAMEKGLAGFGQYMYDETLFIENEASRSKVAVQSKRPLRAGGFTAQKYLTEIINGIAEELIVRIKQRV